MQVETVGQEHFRRLAVKFRQASNGKQVRAGLTKAIRTHMAEGVEGVQQAVRGMDVKGVKGGGRAQRAAHYAATHSRPRARGHGLRDHIARSTRSRVKYTGITVGARIYIDRGAMPADQKKLPAAVNRGRWRHPVYGHRDRWVTQTAAPAPYFDPPLRRLVPKIRNGIVVAVNEALKELQR